MVDPDGDVTELSAEAATADPVHAPEVTDQPTEAVEQNEPAVSADEPTPDPVHARPDAAETEPADEPVEDYDERGEIPVPEDVDYRDLDADTRAGLRSLPKGLAENTGRRLVAAGRLLDEDPERALAHALVARRLASRIAVVREAVGVTAYHAGQWQLAIGELRTAQRLTGTRAHLAMIADAERALGRPERAVDAYRDLEGAKVDDETRIELLIVAAGARRDMGQGAAAVAMLQVPELESNRAEPWLPRLRYAFADALAEQGRVAEAREWFTRVAASDEDDELGAGERLLELEGVAWLAEPDDDDRPVD